MFYRDCIDAFCMNDFNRMFDAENENSSFSSFKCYNQETFDFSVHKLSRDFLKPTTQALKSISDFPTSVRK